MNKPIKERIITKENDILICARNGSQRLIGKNAIIKKEDANNTFGAFMMVYRSKDNPFILPLLSTKRYFSQVGENLGARINQITTSDFNGFDFYFPNSHAERAKIAELFRLIDERIATQNKIIEKLETLIKGICNKSLYTVNGTAIQLGDILIERRERTVINNQYEVLSSTVKGIFSQREYFSKDIASENNVGYKIIRLHDVVLSPQNLWMGNVNYNDNFEVGIVSPSYKVFSIAENLDKRYIATLLKTHRALYNYMLVSEQGASIVRRNLNMEAFEQITFKIPPLSKQEKIGNAISILQARITSAIRIKTAYEAQKQWLLTQMFI
ncbi:type I restriction modification DNA specificity domain protein [Bacteroides fragilis str. 2-F-2 |uniref:Type I restriction modification DNA specificity domain protein n=3 Tax=Bacteroides fragilis TaxID=817 RepID=A0A015YIR9_BACFG|nr:type I restriction modification DNA specificity domain protein [Bacteroides fragilis str. 2-F-2 \